MIEPNTGSPEYDPEEECKLPEVRIEDNDCHVSH